MKSWHSWNHDTFEAMGATNLSLWYDFQLTMYVMNKNPIIIMLIVYFENKYMECTVDNNTNKNSQ